MGNAGSLERSLAGALVALKAFGVSADHTGKKTDELEGSFSELHSRTQILTAGLSSAFAGMTQFASGIGSVVFSMPTLLAGLAGIAVALGAVTLAAGPVLLAMAGVAALGAKFDLFGNSAPHLKKGFSSTLEDLYHTVGKLAGVVTKPLFGYLLRELKQLDAWAKTQQFKNIMQQIGKALPVVAKFMVNAGKTIVEWWASHWPTWEQIIRVTIGLISGLAHAAQKYWPDFVKAAQALWRDTQPIITSLVNLFDALKPAIEWLGQHSAGPIKLFAAVIKTAMQDVATIINDVATAISGVISGLQWVGSHIGLVGSGKNAQGYGRYGLSTGRGYSSVGHRAFGGMVYAGQSYIVGEVGPELFTPRTTGTITPNSALAGAGGTYNPTINMWFDGEQIKPRVVEFIDERNRQVSMRERGRRRY